MAKFKRGDFVEVTTGNYAGNGGVVMSVKRELPDGTGIYAVRLHGKSASWEFSDRGLKAANSCLNAKFKVGDKVKLPDGKVGVVKKVTSFGGVSDNIIEVPGMSLTSRRDDELTLANSALNAKFKVGDKVETTYTSGIGTIKKETIDAFTGKKHYKVVFPSGLSVNVDESDMTLANSSTLPVVANGNIKSGDEVIFKGKPELGRFWVMYIEGDSAKIRSKALGAPDTFEKVSHLTKVGRAVYDNASKSNNSVVANALAWKARNAKGKIIKSSAGTYILVRSDGAPMGEYTNEPLAKKAAAAMRMELA